MASQKKPAGQGKTANRENPASQQKTAAAQPAVPAITARIDKLLDGDGKTRAFASAAIGGAFAVHGIRVIEGEKGLFVAMPQDSYKKNGQNVYKDTFHAITAEARDALIEAVGQAYDQKLAEVQSQEQESGPMSMSM